MFGERFVVIELILCHRRIMNRCAASFMHSDCDEQKKTIKVENCSTAPRCFLRFSHWKNGRVLLLLIQCVVWQSTFKTIVNCNAQHCFYCTSAFETMNRIILPSNNPMKSLFCSTNRNKNWNNEYWIGERKTVSSVSWQMAWRKNKNWNVVHIKIYDNCTRA